MYGSHSACISMADSTRVTTPGMLERVLQRQRVDHRRQHPHLVGGRTIHPARLVVAAADKIAGADYQRELNAQRRHFLDFERNLGQRVEIESRPLRGSERLAG